MPARIANKPELFYGNALFLNAWFDLDTERDRTKYQRITRSMCFEYADDYDLDEEQKEDLWYHIGTMDREFLGWWIKKQPKARTAGETTKGKRGGKNAGNIRKGVPEES